MSDATGGVGRGSDTHSPRVDDQLAHEVDALVHGTPDEGRTEGRCQEDLPTAGTEAVQRGDLGPPAPGLDETDLELRATLGSHLAGVAWPARTEEIREAARADFAPEEVLELLDRLPDGLYDTVSDVWREAGGPTESRN